MLGRINFALQLLLSELALEISLQEMVFFQGSTNLAAASCNHRSKIRPK